MKLKLVTISGADDNVNHNDLITLSEKYPFVEWGILCSPDYFNDGYHKFPKLEWIQSFQKSNINTSGHLCDGFVTKVVTGKIPFTSMFPFWKMFNRLQLNLAGKKYEIASNFLTVALKTKKPLVIQMDNINNDLFFQLHKEKANVLPVFDSSFNFWSKSVLNTFHGYAGDFTPDNLEEQIIHLNTLTNADTWIDIQSGIRTDNEFDLIKVEKCLKIANKFIC